MTQYTLLYKALGKKILGPEPDTAGASRGEKIKDGATSKSMLLPGRIGQPFLIRVPPFLPYSCRPLISKLQVMCCMRSYRFKRIPSNDSL